MSRKLVISCDAPGCTKTKGETNRWWGLLVDREHKRITIYTPGSDVWPSGYSNNEFKDTCGEEHLLAVLSSVLVAIA